MDPVAKTVGVVNPKKKHIRRSAFFDPRSREPTGSEALVGSFVFIPLTMIAFAIGGAIRTGTGQSYCQIFTNILYDLATNPVIFMTCVLGLQNADKSPFCLSPQKTSLRAPSPTKVLFESDVESPNGLSVNHCVWTLQTEPSACYQGWFALQDHLWQ